MRIRSKLGLILLVPLIVLIAVATLRLYDLTTRAFEADDMVGLVEFNAVVADLRYDLQQERSVLITYLRNDDDHVAGLDMGEYDIAAVQARAAESDDAYADFLTSADQLDGSLEDITNLVTVVATQYATLEQVREAAETSPDTTSIDSSSRVYQRLVGGLVAITDTSARVVPDPEIARQLQVIAAATEILERTEEQRAIGINVGDGNRFLNNSRWKNFIAQAEARVEASADFRSVANREEQLDFYFSPGGLTSEQAKTALQFELETSNAATTNPISLDVETTGAYDAILSNGLSFIDAKSGDVISQARSDRDAQIFQLLLEAILILAAFVIATVVALIIARNMASGLRRLREGALDVAHVSLPQAVAQMRDAESLGSRTPDQVAAESGSAIDIDQRDEIGNVAHAFNIVHTEAIRIAAEQAALRANVSQMFINLARRSQNLVDRLIGHLDHLERGEENPDRLAELFQLDHLATRMRRNDENLLVLAGADSTRQERHPAPVSDVLQAAQSEVEQYTRIQFGHVGADREVKPAAVNDLVHLVAELMDNATAFSPPEAEVLVEAEQIRTPESPMGAIRVRIADFGIGMPEAQLEEINRQLSEDTDVIDLASSRMMGLVVVARLAKRHSVRVILMPGEQRGTVAELVMGEAVLTDPRQPEHRGMDSGETVSLGSGDRGPRGELPMGADPMNGTGQMPRMNAAGPGYADSREMNQMRVPDNAAGLFDNVSQQQAYPSPPRHAAPVPPVPSQPPAAQMPPAGVEPLTGEHPTQDSEPGFMFRPGGSPDPSGRSNGKVMEVTGEIVSSEHVALPKIQLEAAPVTETEPPPPMWPDTAGGLGTEAPRASKRNDRVSAIDETAELPIFREVESAWFKAATPAPKAVDDTEGRPSEPAVANPWDEIPAPIPAAQPTEDASMHESSPPPTPPPPAEEPYSPPPVASPPEPASPLMPVSAAPLPSDSAGYSDSGYGEQPLERRRLQTEPGGEGASSGYAWRTAADDGWQQVDAALTDDVDETTSAGLPRRRPMERLVPGGVEESQETVSAQKRNPEGIRGLLSAYHRGVQRGRGNDA